MKTLASKPLKLSLLAFGTIAALLSTGCSTPGYSAKERGNLIARNIAMEWQMMQDDIDRALLLRPMSVQTGWNVH